MSTHAGSARLDYKILTEEQTAFNTGTIIIHILEELTHYCFESKY